MADLTTIGNDKIKVTIDTEMGTNIRALYVNKNNEWLEVMPDTVKENSTLDACSFLMVPYSNRIENGKFEFEGKSYQLKNGENHSIHGDVRKRPWKVEKLEQKEVICSFDTKDFNDINWPWNFSVNSGYTIENCKFISTLKIKNCSNEKMPVGCGWHPYFNRVLKNGDKVSLEMQVEGVYPDADGNCIPCGPVQELKSEQDFRKLKEIDPDQHLDSCFSGYNGKGYMRWSESGLKLNFHCSDNCKHLIIFNPKETFFAVEPVTNANNGVNMIGKEKYDHGVIILEPFEEVEVYFVMCFNV